MNKKIAWLGLIIISLSLVGCKMTKSHSKNPSRVQDKLINMKGYACLARITHINDDNTNTYETKQVYQMDGNYRFEVTKPKHIEGLTTICNGEKIIQYNPKVDNPKPVELPVNDFRNQIFLGTFVKNYLQSEEVAIEVQKIDNDITTVLEAVIPGGSKHMSVQRLWVDQKTHNPIRMGIYNQEGKENITIEFIEFTYNPKIDERIFTID